MVLKDGRQDTGLVSEHLTYEVYRRAGIAEVTVLSNRTKKLC